MKNFLIVLALCCFAGMTRAQHIEFKNIPLNGEILDFTEKMREGGLKLQKKMTDDFYYIYKGTFVGNSAYVRVDYTPKSHTVYRIQVTPKHVDIPTYVDSLTTHYGKDYVQNPKGYQWSCEHGGVYFFTPEGKDPTLVIMDAVGIQKLKEERE